MGKIFIIDDDLDWWKRQKVILDQYHNFIIWSFRGDFDINLKHHNYDCIILSYSSLSSEKFKLLKKIKKITEHTPIIAISDSQDPALIKKSSEQGISDFLTKPFVTEKLLLSIEKSLEMKRLKNEIDYLKRQEDIVYDFSKIISHSPVMKNVITTLKKFSRTDSTIFLTGETGTGKSFLSGSIHYNSLRRDRPFIKINCANLPETLLESELFGHEKGAFTGADKTRLGRLEQAKGGTVFLDEICEMPLSLQAKLLRVLEDKSFERIGSSKTIFSDVRIISATNREPEIQVSKGNFRNDLYYRLNVLRVHLPPLRERKECIEPLAKHLLEKICGDLKKKSSGFTLEVLENIKKNLWPGNIRELANTIERALILEESSFIRNKNFIMPFPFLKESEKAEKIEREQSETSPKTLEKMEKNQIVQALEKNDWFQKDAARQLGLTPRAINYKIKKFGITHPRWRRNK